MSTLSAVAQDDLDREQAVLKRYVDLLEKQPKPGPAFDRVYRHHVERGSLDAFLAPYRTQSTGEAALLLGLMEAQRGRDAEATKHFVRAEELRAADPLPAFYLARVRAAEHDFAGSIAACERALGKQPSRTDLLEITQLLAQMQSRTGLKADAIKTWLKLETQFASESRVLERVARGLLDAGDAEAARQRFEKLSKQATDPTARVQFAIKAAELQLLGNDREVAINSLDRLLEGLKPDSWPARLIAQKIEDAYLKDDDLKGLEAYYESRSKRSVNDVDGPVRLARLLARQQRVDEAITTLRRLLMTAPSARAARQSLIDLLVLKRQWDEVARQYVELDRLAPGDVDNVRVWGQAVLRDESRSEVERRRDASAIWSRLLEQKPTDAALHLQVAEWLRSTEQHDDALKLVRRAIDLAPNEAQYREVLGEYLLSLDRRTEAIAAWREMASGPRKSAESLSRLGQLLRNQNEVESALEAYSEATRIAPRLPDLLALARLQRDLKRYDDALQSLTQASTLAESSEDQQRIETEELTTLQAGDRIGAELQRLRDRQSKREATVAELMRLARMSLQLERLDDALLAARQAVLLATAKNSADTISPRPGTPGRGAGGEGQSEVAARTLLATIAQQAKQWFEAAEQRQWLAEHDRRAETAHLTALVEIRRAQQDLLQALRASERLVAIAPDHPEHRRLQSELLFELKRPIEGLAALREAARRGGDSQAWTGLAQKLAQFDRQNEAIETYWYGFGLAKNEDERFAIVRALGKLTRKSGQFARVVQRLERLRFEGQQDVAMRRCLVELHRSVGDSKSAIELLRTLHADEPNNARTMEELVALHQARGEFAPAIDMQAQLVRLEPSTANERLLASLLLASGDTAEHETLIQRLAARPMSPAERLEFIDDLVKAARWTSAMHVLEGDVKRHPQDWELLFRLAMLKHKQGRLTEALRYFAQLRRLNPEHRESVLTRQKAVEATSSRLIGDKMSPIREPSADGGSRWNRNLQTSLREAINLRIAHGQSAIKEGNKLLFGPAFRRDDPTSIHWTMPIDFDSAATVALHAVAIHTDQSAEARRDLQSAEQELNPDSKVSANRLWDWLVVRDELSEIQDQDNKRKYPGPSVAKVVSEIARREPVLGSVLLLMWFNAATNRSHELTLQASLVEVASVRTDNNASTTFELSSSDLVEPKIVVVPPATLDAVLAAFECLRMNHPQHLTVDLEVAELIRQLHHAGRHAVAEQTVQRALSLVRHVPDYGALLAATRGHATRDIVTAALRDRLLNGSTHETSMKSSVTAFDPKREFIQRCQVVEWFLRNDARTSARPALFPLWLAMPTTAEVVDRPLPQYTKPSPYVTPLPGIGGGAGLAPRSIYDNPFGVRPTVHLDDELLLEIRTSLFDEVNDPQAFEVAASQLGEAAKSGTAREQLVLRIAQAVLLSWGRKRESSEAVLYELLQQPVRSNPIATIQQSPVKKESRWNRNLQADEYGLRVELAALRSTAGDFANSLKLLDVELPDTSLVAHRERYALQLAERLKDKTRAKRAIEVLAQRFAGEKDSSPKASLDGNVSNVTTKVVLPEFSSDVWYEITRLCIALDFGASGDPAPKSERSESLTKLWLSQTVPPVAEIGPQMFELTTIHLICGEPDKAIETALQVLKTLPADTPQRVPLFRYQPNYWVRQKELITTLNSSSAVDQKLRALLETIHFHQRWTEQTRYLHEVQQLLAKYETESPEALIKQSRLKLAESKHEEAIDLVSRACFLRKELLDEHLVWIEQVFESSGRREGFTKLLLETNLKDLRKASRRAVELARARVTNGQGTVEALRLLRAGQAVLPRYPQVALQNLDDATATRHWPLFLIQYEDLFPSEVDGRPTRPWLGLDNHITDAARSNQGTVEASNSRPQLSFEDIVNALSDSKVRAAFAQEIIEQRKRVPNWLSGEFYLAYLELQDNQFDAARSRLVKLSEVAIPTGVQSRMARIIARVQNAEAVSIAFLERLCEREPTDWQRLNDQPVWHLAWMHSKRNERQRIEAVLARAVTQQEKLIETKLPADDRMMRRYQLWLSHLEVLQEFSCSGESLRRLKLLHGHATKLAPSERPKVWDLALPQILNQDRIKTALSRASFEEASEFLADFVTLADEASTTAQSSVEWQLGISSPGLASSRLTSFFEVCLEAASKLEDRERLDLLRERLETAAKRRPDLSVGIAQARLAQLTAGMESVPTRKQEAEDRAFDLARALSEQAAKRDQLTNKTEAGKLSLETHVALWLVARAMPNQERWRSLRTTLETEANYAAQQHPREAWREVLQIEQRRGVP